jgi:murein DD-endopeptidase MepM/ murein hydrolase activator NlpD
MGTRTLVVAIAAAISAAQTSRPPIAVEARSVQPGELVVLTLNASSTDAPSVRAFDKTIAAFHDQKGWQAIVGIDLDAKPGRYVVSVDGPKLHATHELVVQPKTFRTRRLTVNPDFVTPPPGTADRIERDNRLLSHAWQSSAAERLWHDPFERPVKEEANSAFGTRSIFNGQPRNAHGGADFLSPAGTPIRSPNAGHVLIAEDLYFSGNTVVIDHGLGLFSMLAHLSAFDVHEGDEVARGQVLGRVGATGRVTGPHLHWAVRANGARVDPLSLLAVLGGQ